REAYRSLLATAGITSQPDSYSEDALLLDEPVTVTSLPGFELGWCSVQDASAQLAAELLAPGRGQRVLDACSAPGGKACHLLERYPEINLSCLDSDKSRLAMVEDNLTRLNLQAEIVVGDARNPADWWDGELYDAILIDAPCTGLGVIRRNPDIKALRQAGDIDRLAKLQASILKGLWPCLRPGGTLLYATCSIAPKENSEQVGTFLKNHPAAVEREISATWGITQTQGRQILPTDGGGDGFFYALISKPLQS
ncbi:MAG: 16S rRNA (cytosine967-C5)-methyltransferase, partial [Halieaceae bacterium]